MKITHFKFALIFLSIICFNSTLFAQWSNEVITSHSGSAQLDGSSGHPFVYLNDIVGTTAFSGIMWQETNLQRAFIARDNNLNLLHIGNAASGNIGDIQINTSGQIGINTAPDAAFRMNLLGNAKFEGIESDGTTGTGSVEITRAGTSRFMVIDDNEIETSGSALYLNHNLANNVYMVTGGGNVGIGTSSPTQKLHVEGDIFVQGLIVQPSDIRLKKNIIGLSGGIEIIKRLRPVSFEFREINGLGLKKEIQAGLIAQEVYEVLPQIVINDVIENEEGDDFSGIDYTKLIPYLIAGMKEQQLHIEKLQAEIDQLKKQQEKGN